MYANTCLLTAQPLFSHMLSLEWERCDIAKPSVLNTSGFRIAIIMMVSCWLHPVGIKGPLNAPPEQQITLQLCQRSDELPRTNTHRRAHAVSAIQQLLSNGHSVSRAACSGGCGIGAHPADASAKLVDSLLHSATGDLIVFCNFLIPASILQLNSSCLFRCFTEDSGPGLGNLFICLVLVSVVLVCVPLG
jgi:hypothetical protein